jgi:hypothetical protein
MKTITNAILALALCINAAAENIPGLTPSDVYLSLEAKGFTTEKDYRAEGSRYICKRQTGGCFWSGQVYAPSGDSTKVLAVMGMVQNQTGDTAHTDEWSAPFLAYVASLPYTGSTPKEAMFWVNTNVGRNTEKQFGPAKIQLFAKSDTRMIRISMEPLEAPEVTTNTLPTITHLAKPKVKNENAALPEVGKSFAEVTALHGKPSIQDPDTGWAIWTSFKAKFKDGLAVEVTR